MTNCLTLFPTRRLLIFIYLFFVVLGFELRAYTMSHSTSHFCDGFFSKIGSHEVFALGLAWNPPEWLGLQV
jgi:hypothetical protein